MRADRMGSARRRRQFIAGRYLLAYLIRQRWGVKPVIVTTESGALELTGLNLRCSIAHSGEGVAVAVGSQPLLGVDMERLRPRRFEVLASHYFHISDVVELRALPANQRGEAFYRLWTRKEAVAKAHGKGVTLAGLATASTCESLALHTISINGFMISVAGSTRSPPVWQQAFCESDGKLEVRPIHQSEIGHVEQQIFH